MNRVEMSLREASGHALAELGEKYKNFVVIDTDVAGGTMTSIFRDKYPQRFYQIGIAEQNAVSIAAGMSTTGIIPVYAGYGVFVSMRAIEQIRNLIAYPELNVKIISSHTGIDGGQDGASHQAIEDIGIVRSIPNIKILVPCDRIEVKKCIEEALKVQGPFYIRTARTPVQDIYDESYEFRIGKGDVIKEGKDITIIAMGLMVHRALNAANMLEKEGIDVKVINMASIKPIDEELIIKSAKETGAIMTCEDHNIINGLGAAVSQIIVKNKLVPMDFIGVNDVFAESGHPFELYKKYGLDEKTIEFKVKQLINRKGE